MGTSREDDLDRSAIRRWWLLSQSAQYKEELVWRVHAHVGSFDERGPDVRYMAMAVAVAYYKGTLDLDVWERI